MTCTDPIRQCLDWHYRPHLASAALEDNGNRVRARCPACGSNRAFTASPGNDKRVVAGCFNGCPEPALRAALRTAGVPAGCLPPLSKNDARMINQAAVAAFQQGATGSRAQAHLRAYLICLGYSRWPKGNELLKLAAECGVSKAEAYNAKKDGPLLSSTLVPPVPMGSDRGL